VSLGAPFVTIVGSMDGRISRVWAVHGSGGSFAPLEASLKRSIGFAPLRYAAAGAANVIIAGPRLAPERWAAGIAPRPFVMVNAADDERLPKDAVDRLFASAAQPKELIWMPGGHIHGDAPTIQRIVEIVMRRIAVPEGASGPRRDSLATAPTGHGSKSADRPLSALPQRGQWSVVASFFSSSA
jgi:hypothetical protein